MENFRRKLIYKKFQRRAYHNIEIPEIRLEGRWLEALGFLAGKAINIVSEPARLVITVLNDSPIEPPRRPKKA